MHAILNRVNCLSRHILLEKEIKPSYNKKKPVTKLISVCCYELFEDFCKSRSEPIYSMELLVSMKNWMQVAFMVMWLYPDESIKHASY